MAVRYPTASKEFGGKEYTGIQLKRLSLGSKVKESWLRGQEGRELRGDPNRPLEKYFCDGEEVLGHDLREGAHEDWDQLGENERLFNLRADFDESVYTTPLNKDSLTREQLAKGASIAESIEKMPSNSYHVRMDRGQLSQKDLEDDNEEKVFSAVLGTGRFLNEGRATDFGNRTTGKAKKSGFPGKEDKRSHHSHKDDKSAHKVHANGEDSEHKAISFAATPATFTNTKKEVQAPVQAPVHAPPHGSQVSPTAHKPADGRKLASLAVSEQTQAAVASDALAHKKPEHANGAQKNHVPAAAGTVIGSATGEGTAGTASEKSRTAKENQAVHAERRSANQEIAREPAPKTQEDKKAVGLDGPTPAAFGKAQDKSKKEDKPPSATTTSTSKDGAGVNASQSQLRSNAKEYTPKPKPSLQVKPITAQYNKLQQVYVQSAKKALKGGMASEQWLTTTDSYLEKMRDPIKLAPVLAAQHTPNVSQVQTPLKAAPQLKPAAPAVSPMSTVSTVPTVPTVSTMSTMSTVPTVSTVPSAAAKPTPQATVMPTLSSTAQPYTYPYPGYYPLNNPEYNTGYNPSVVYGYQYPMPYYMANGYPAGYAPGYYSQHPGPPMS